MHVTESSVRLAAVFAAICQILLMCAGCGDMPIIEKGEINRVIPRITVGPYLVEEADGGMVMRFDTDRRCVAGLRLMDSRNRVERFATFNTAHRIPVTGLRQGVVTRGQILLDNFVGTEFSLSGMPSAGEPVRLGLAGGAAEPDILRQLAKRLDGITLDAMIFCESPLGAETDIKKWQHGFLAPFSGLARRVPFYFPPGAGESVPRQLYPRLSPLLWSRNFGCVHVIGVSSSALRKPAERERLLRMMEADLAHKPESVPWSVLVVSQPIFGARNVNARLLQVMGDRLERWGVNLVVSGGVRYYHRTIPLRLALPAKVRYVSTGGLGAGTAAGSGREYSAVISDKPHVCMIEADQGVLKWRVLGIDGSLIDSLALSVDGGSVPNEPSLDKQEILTESLAVLTQRYEAVAIARQVCRAVRDPGRSQVLTLRLENHSSRPFKGQLRWSLKGQGSWRVEPAAMRFALAPGQVGNARFQVGPGPDPRLAPALTVDVGSVGYTRQQLILARQKSINVPRVRGECSVDGYFNEAFWKTAIEVRGFSVLGTNKPASQALRCWLAYNDKGLGVAMHCREHRPAKAATFARQHDDSLRRDEGVAVYLDPVGRARDFYEFAVNVKGVTLDRSCRFGIGWEPAWKHAVKYGKDDKGKWYYDVEILIPWAAFGLTGAPGAGTRWAINLVRNDTVIAGADKAAQGRGVEVVQWAPTFGSNDRSGLYGVAKFMGEVK